MTPYAIYEKATGRIVMNGRGLEQDARTHVGPGQEILLVDGDWRTQFVQDGQVLTIPPAPDDSHEWNWTSKAWVVKGMDDLRNSKWELMKAARAIAIEAPLVTPYGTFDADVDSAANIVRTAQLMQTEAQSLAPGADPTEDFTLADNTVVRLTAGQMVQVALMLASQIKSAYARGRVVRAAIESAATPQALDAISW